MTVELEVGESSVRRLAGPVQIPTAHGPFLGYAYESSPRAHQHLAVTCGEVAGRPDVLVRLHSECLTGDVFGSLRCDCGVQLDAALAAIASEGTGVVVYLRGHEGRGIGLAPKLLAYGLQDQGHDTVDANVELGLPVDARDYGIGARILADLGVRSVRLMTNNPDKTWALEASGLEVRARVPIAPAPNPHNIAYLRTKRERLGHLLDDLGEAP